MNLKEQNAEVVKYLREVNKTTQQDLSTRFGLAIYTIRSIKCGAYLARVDTAIKLAKAFGIDLVFLIWPLCKYQEGKVKKVLDVSRQLRIFTTY